MALTTFQNFYESTLSAPMTATDLVVSLAASPTPTEGWLLVDYDVPAKREFIYYTSRTSTTVTLPSLAIGRGRDSTTAIAHSQNAKVRMNVNGGLLQDISGLSATIVNSNNNGGWVAMGVAPSTVVANGQRSYTMTWNGTDQTGTLNPGTRLRTTRTVAAPTQCTSLNGTTQYYSKSSPAGMTFTDDFVVSAYIKLSSYVAGSIVSRYNGTSGWDFQLTSSGQIQLLGVNAGAANYKSVISYQSIPLNKWVHITAELDMNTATVTSTTNYIMVDGVDVPAQIAQGGTNPTALIQAGNLEIGSRNAGTQFFPGKIAQVAVFNAKVTQATMLTYMSQGLAGTETSLISAYSFNNSINDLNANANNLTANGSAVATNADSPFGVQANGLVSSTLDYGIVQSATFSTNTTVVVQVPEGCTIPTSGGVSAVSYSGQKAPYGFPPQKSKWQISSLSLTPSGTYAFGAINQWTTAVLNMTTPIGSWVLGYQGTFIFASTVSGIRSGFITLSSPAPTNSVYSQDLTTRFYVFASSTTLIASNKKEIPISLVASATYTLYGAIDVATGTETFGTRGDQGAVTIYADNAYL